MSSIAKLVDYIDCKSPGFEEKMLGADEDELAKIEKLAGRVLPATYKEYLAAMGAFAVDFAPSCFSLDMYDVRRSLATDVRHYPDRYVKIGFGAAEGEVPMDLFLDFGSVFDRDEPAVVTFEDDGDFEPDDVSVLSWNLLEFLLEGAFAQYDVRRFAHSDIVILLTHRDGGPGGSAFSRARKALQGLGFAAVFDTPHVYAGSQGQGAALLLSPPLGQPVSLELSMSEEQPFKSVVSIFNDLSESIDAGR